MAGEEGNANLPVFYSENISDVYYTSEPNRKKKEIIKASKLTAVGIQDGILTSQFTGSSFEEYNFNQNKLLIFEKEFLSPISDNSLFFYDFFITDTVYLDNFRCFQIKVRPKNNRDLLFTGFIWITDSTWSLKQVNLEIPKSVNINFIERVQVQQELEPTTAGAWLTIKSRVVVDFADISKNTVGMIAKIFQTIRLTRKKNYNKYKQLRQILLKNCECIKHQAPKVTFGKCEIKNTLKILLKSLSLKDFFMNYL